MKAEERLAMVEEQRKMEEERQRLRKEQEKRVKEEQKKILGKNNSRPKLSFSLKPVTWTCAKWAETCVPIIVSDKVNHIYAITLSELGVWTCIIIWFN